MRIGKTTQDRLHELLKTQQFIVRYEQGSFKGGFCIVREKRMVVINKFFPMEAKIQTLIEVIRGLEWDPSLLSIEQHSLLEKIKEEV